MKANKHSHWIHSDSGKKRWNYHSLPLLPVKIKQKYSSVPIHPLTWLMWSFILPLALHFQWQNSCQCFFTTAYDAWYHKSLNSWKKAASVLGNPCFDEKGQDTMVYLLSPKAFGRAHGSQCAGVFSSFYLLQQVYWKFSQIAVQHCSSRAGITLWTSQLLKICVLSLSLVVCLPPPQSWYPGPRSFMEPIKGLWSSYLGLANTSQHQGNSNETFLLKSFPAQCYYHGSGA